MSPARAEDPVASYCELCDQNAGKDDGNGEDDDEENMDRRRKPIEPLPRVSHDEIEYTDVEFAFYMPHPEILAKKGSHSPTSCVGVAWRVHNLICGAKLSETILHKCEEAMPPKSSATGCSFTINMEVLFFIVGSVYKFKYSDI